MSKRAAAPGRGSRAVQEGILEGVRPVLEAIRAQRRAVREVTMPADLSTPGLQELAATARAHGVPIVHARSSDASGRVRVSARVGAFPESSIEDLLVRAGPRFWVALDGVTDVGNLGSIARSAETAGASALVLEQRRSPPVDGGAARASAGAIEHLEVARVPNLGRALELASTEGVSLVGADMKGSPLRTLAAERVAGDLICVFGSEDRGLRPGVRARMDALVSIPLRGRIASLGVAASAGIVLHHIAELRGASTEASDVT